MDGSIVWYNGKLVPEQEARVAITKSPTLHYGVGCFEGIRCRYADKGPAIFRLEDHVNRLFYSASALNLKMPYDKEAVAYAITRVLWVNELKEAYIRPKVFLEIDKDGVELGLGTLDACKVSLAIFAYKRKDYLGNEPTSAKITDIRRLPPECIVPEAKIDGHYINSINATNEAKKSGFKAALMLDIKGHVAEGAAQNFFMVVKDSIYTPAKGSILPGITRDSVMKIAKDLGIFIEESNLGLDDVAVADEAFFTGTATGIAPIGKINDIILPVENKGVTSLLKEKYSNIVRGKDKKYSNWLTYI